MADSKTPNIGVGSDPSRQRVKPLVSEDFTPPDPPRVEDFWLEPLGEQHNEADYAAWTSSLEHIRRTPGFTGGDWPHEMSLDDNADDLRMHARHFREGRGYTYTVRSTHDDDVVGCVYIYPSRDSDANVDVRSWVRESHTDLDTPLWATVSAWLASAWPFEPGRIAYASRPP